VRGPQLWCDGVYVGACYVRCQFDTACWQQGYAPYLQVYVDRRRLDKRAGPMLWKGLVSFGSENGERIPEHPFLAHVPEAVLVAAAMHVVCESERMAKLFNGHNMYVHAQDQFGRLTDLTPDDRASLAIVVRRVLGWVAAEGSPLVNAWRRVIEQSALMQRILQNSSSNN
jgi:hypothetical protein